MFQQFIKQLVQNYKQHAMKSHKWDLEFGAPQEKLGLRRIDFSFHFGFRMSSVNSMSTINILTTPILQGI